MKRVLATFFLLFVSGCMNGQPLPPSQPLLPSSEPYTDPTLEALKVRGDRILSDANDWIQRRADLAIRKSALDVRTKKVMEEEKLLVSTFTDEELKVFIEHQTSLVSGQPARIKLSGDRFKAVFSGDKFLKTMALWKEKLDCLEVFDQLQKEERLIDKEQKRIQREHERFRHDLDMDLFYKETRYRESRYR